MNNAGRPSSNEVSVGTFHYDSNIHIHSGQIRLDFSNLKMFFPRVAW